MTAAPLARAFAWRPAVDGARAFAVSMVLVSHATYLLVPEWAGRWVPGGFLGVDLFFVLSGFLITTLLLKEHRRSGTISLRWFYARRALRLLPAVVVLLGVHAVLAGAVHAGLHRELGTDAAVLLYVTNWAIVAGASMASGLGHLWSLSVEEQFYLVWPAVLLLGLRGRRPTRAIVAVALAAIAWAVALRALLWRHGAAWEVVYMRTDLRMDALLVGVLLAVAFARGRRLPAAGRHVGTVPIVVLVVCLATVRDDSAWLYVGCAGGRRRWPGTGHGRPAPRHRRPALASAQPVPR